MNVVCILLDTLRRDHLGSYGNSWIQTPNLDRLASNGAKFTNSYLGSYPCMPARQDLFTGRLNFLWRGWSPLEYDEDNLPSILSREKKTSMLVTDHYHLWSYGSGNYHFGFTGTEFIRGQERDNWITSPRNEIRYPASPDKLHKDWEAYARNTAGFKKEEDYFAAQVFQKSMDWVEENKDLDDFFLFIDCFDPHEPFDPPPGYAEMYNPGYTGESVVWPRTGKTDYLSEEELKQVHALYCGEVTYVDRWFGKFYDKLEALGLLDNTMVIVTSDHGFLFGEHDWLGKHARILYQDIARTPLLIQSPDIPAGSSYDTLVQMHDLTPTILNAMGISPPPEMQGENLAPLWSGADLAQAGSCGIRQREEIIFGVFGGPVYCTDGEWVLVKKPAEGNHPLYWYTRSHFQSWGFGGENDLQSTRARAGQWLGDGFAVQYPDARPGHAGPRYVANKEDLRTSVSEPHDELYHIREDPGQTNNLGGTHPDMEARLQHALSQTMTALGAPEEQWVRLGLEKESESL